MRGTAGIVGLVVALAGCGDDGGGTVSASGTGTDPGTTAGTTTATPTTGGAGEASDTDGDDGTASATGTGTTTGTTTEGVTGSSSSSSGSSTTSDETSGSSSGESTSSEGSSESTSSESSSESTSSEGSSSGTEESSSETGQGADGLMNLFDPLIGENMYTGGLSDGNWETAPYVQHNAGVTAFGSANGNAAGSFPGLGLTKNLGGAVADTPYEVSFFVTMYIAGYQGIELADFSTLRIGGPAGVVEWTDTPTPTVEDEWVQWTGTYTPAPADIGGPFFFEMVFDLDAMHAVGFDGVVSAVPVP
jgi:hypothetical protein